MYLKSLHRYDWIVVLDVDEVIVPRKQKSWAEMMKNVGSSSCMSSYHPLLVNIIILHDNTPASIYILDILNNIIM